MYELVIDISQWNLSDEILVEMRSCWVVLDELGNTCRLSNMHGTCVWLFKLAVLENKFSLQWV